MEAKKDKPFRHSQRCLHKGTKVCGTLGIQLLKSSSFILPHMWKKARSCRFFGGRTYCENLGLQENLKKKSTNDIHSIAIWTAQRPTIHVSIHVNTFLRNVGHVFGRVVHHSFTKRSVRTEKTALCLVQPNTCNYWRVMRDVWKLDPTQMFFVAWKLNFFFCKCILHAFRHFCWLD